MERKQKHRGRPTIPPQPGKRSTVSLRLTADIKAKLDKAAKAADRPFSQEAELRLERSFDREQLLPEILTLAFGAELAGILLMLGTAMHETGTATGFMSKFTLEGASAWFNDPFAYEQAKQAALQILRSLKPAGEVVAPKVPSVIPDIAEKLGIGFANSVLAAVSGEDGTEADKTFRDTVKPLMGSLVKRIADNAR
jgi:hypothetical protein